MKHHGRAKISLNRRHASDAQMLKNDFDPIIAGRDDNILDSAIPKISSKILSYNGHRISGRCNIERERPLAMWEIDHPFIHPAIPNEHVRDERFRVWNLDAERLRSNPRRLTCNVTNPV